MIEIPDETGALFEALQLLVTAYQTDERLFQGLLIVLERAVAETGVEA
jgi:hypothetical protein